MATTTAKKQRGNKEETTATSEYVDMVVNMLNSSDEESPKPSLSSNENKKKKKKKKKKLMATTSDGSQDGLGLTSSDDDEQVLRPKRIKKKKLKKPKETATTQLKSVEPINANPPRRKRRRERPPTTTQERIDEKNKDHAPLSEKSALILPPTELRSRNTSTFSATVRASALEYAILEERQQSTIELQSANPNSLNHLHESGGTDRLHDSGISSSRLHDSGISSGISVEDWNDEANSNDGDALIKFRNRAAAAPTPETLLMSDNDEEVHSHSDAPTFQGDEENAVILAQTGVPAPPGLHQGRRLIQPGAFRMSSSEPPRRANRARPALSSAHGADEEEFVTRSHHTNHTTRSPQSSRHTAHTGHRTLTSAGGHYLVEASLVPDTPVDDGDEEAPEQYDPRRSSRRSSHPPMVEAKVFDDSRERCMSRFIKCVICTAILVLVGAGAVVAIVLTGTVSSLPVDIAFWDKDNDDSSPSDPPPPPPFEAFRQGLPEDTQQALESPVSPQFAAFRWVEQDENFDLFPPERQTQRFVLATLFFATNGDQWEMNGSWLEESTEECQWHSDSPEACGNDGLFSILSLQNNNLAESLPREISLLRGLTTLNVASNQLNGNLPNSLASLFETLQYVSFAHNPVRGTIPTSWGSLIHLQELNLEATQITGSVPDEVCALVDAGLRLTLDCQTVVCPCDCVCMDAPPTIAPTPVPTATPTRAPTPQPTLTPTQLSPGIALLRALLPEQALASAAIPDSPQNRALAWMALDPQIDTYPDFRLVQRFAMATFFYSTDGPGWWDYEGWRTFQHECSWYSDAVNPCIAEELTRLELQDHFLDGTLPPEIGLLTALQVIRLSDNKLQSSIPTEIGLLKNLVELHLYTNRLNDELPTEIASLPLLQDLDVEDNLFTGRIPDELGDLVNLRHLLLSYNRFTGEIPESLGNLVNLDSLSMRNNPNLQGEVPSSFQNHVHITSISLTNMNLTGEIDKSFWSAWRNADTVDIGFNYFTGELCTEIGELQHLEYLDVYSNWFHGTIPPELGNLDQLEYLYLEGNYLTNNGNVNLPSELARLPKLRLIHAHDNLLSGVVPEELCERVRNNGLELSVDCGYVQCPYNCGCRCDLSSHSSTYGNRKD